MASLRPLRTVALVVFVPSIVTAATGPVNEAAIREVKEGKRPEARAAWWGFDPEDSTKALQSAIDSGAKRLIIEDQGTPWIVGPIRLASNQELVFEKGVVVLEKRNLFRGKNDSLFLAKDRENVTLTGPGATLKMRFVDCIISGCAVKKSELVPISIESRPGSGETIGSMVFENCTVLDELDRPPLTYLDWGGQGLKDVSGSLTVERGGQTTRYTIDDKQLAQWCPTAAQPRVPPFDMKGVSLSPAFANVKTENIRAPKVRVRGEAHYRLYARKGEDVSFTLRSVPVGKRQAKAVPVRVESPSGKEVALKKKGSPHVFAVTRKETGKGEAWSLRIGRPSVGVLEDYYIDVLGIPPLLAGSRESLLGTCPP